MQNKKPFEIKKGLTVTWFFSHPTLKAYNSPYMQYYFKRFFVNENSLSAFNYLDDFTVCPKIVCVVGFFESVAGLSFPVAPQKYVMFLMS